MRFFLIFLLLSGFNIIMNAQGPDKKTIKKQFFLQDTPLEATLTTNIDSLLNAKTSDNMMDALFACKFPDGTTVSDKIQINPRGNFRLQNCEIPPLKLDFKKSPGSKLYFLKSAKLTNGCQTGSYNDQLLLKEYLIYKIYNLLTEKSLRVRLINLQIEDSRKKKNSISIHSFFSEDIDDMAKRNKCKQLDEKIMIGTEATDRMHMTLVSIFQYMIGNTDWSVPLSHNIKKIYLKADLEARPFVVPYDFDHSGFVNADYALPDQQFETTNVRERIYRGYPRSMEELKSVLAIFNAKKEDIYSLIQNFEPLSDKNKTETIKYLDEFYKIINNDKAIKREFINKARID